MRPQDLDDADHTIQAEVTYSITPPSGVTGHAVSRTSTVLLSSSTLTAWTKGKIITYTLVLSSENLIWFSAETSWDSTGAMDETIIVE